MEPCHCVAQLFQHYPVDSNLPPKLWLHACDCMCSEITLALLELNIHALNNGTQLSRTESARLALFSAVRMASCSSPISALCALRALTLVLRYRTPANMQLIQQVYAQAAATVTSADTLCQSLLQWLKLCMDNPATTHTLPGVLRGMRLIQAD